MKKGLLLLLELVVIYSVFAQQPKLQLVQVATGFASPVDIKTCGDNRLFIVDQAGIIKIMDKNGLVNATPFLNITSRVLLASNEQGLLSLAFSPNYKQDSCFYVNYITGTGSGATVISRFHVSPDSNVADVNSEKVLLTFTQPFVNHNGATLMFGPDEYLYDTQGDGGDQGDPNGNGQNKNTYLAKILRLDVSHSDTTYVIPATNPFVDSSNIKHEIWAYGVRNPWRCSFDRLTGDLWIGDVGQSLYEEADFQPANSSGGRNYGWNCREGFHAYNNACASSSGFTDPVFEYVHSTTNGCSIIGGYVYRGAQFAGLFGKYIFTDYCSGRFMDIQQPSAGVFVADTLQSFLLNQYGTFGEDNKGEIYVAGRANGIIYHVTDTSNCLPVAYILPGNFENCNHVQLTALFGDTLHYEWYNSSGSLVGDSVQFTATETGWYKVKVSKRPGCEAFSDSVYATVHHPDTLLPCNCTAGFCIDDIPVSLNGQFSPIGGIYAGTGVSMDSIFSPAIAGVGPDSISYTYIDTFGCVATTSLALQVGDKTALINSVPSITLCNTDSLVSLNGFITPTGGDYSGPAVSNGFFDPAMGLLHNSIYYTYINGYGCISQDTFALTVNQCVGIHEIDQDVQFSIFPNPNNGRFNLKIIRSTTANMQLIVLDDLGRNCFEKKWFSDALPVLGVDLSLLGKGVYILKLKTGDGIWAKPLVIE